MRRVRILVPGLRDISAVCTEAFTFFSSLRSAEARRPGVWLLDQCVASRGSVSSARICL